MRVEVTERRLDPWAEIATYQASRPELSGKYGATATFVGTLRDFNQGTDVQRMWLEHYPGMTQKHLRRIAETAANHWQVMDVLVIHRYGEMKPGDPIVLVAVWSAHRDQAFAACRYIIDELKTRAPFWKREQTSAGERWVEPTVDKP